MPRDKGRNAADTMTGCWTASCCERSDVGCKERFTRALVAAEESAQALQPCELCNNDAAPKWGNKGCNPGCKFDCMALSAWSTMSMMCHTLPILITVEPRLLGRAVVLEKLALVFSPKSWASLVR